jgi:hypothetical protein
MVDVSEKFVNCSDGIGGGLYYKPMAIIKDDSRVITKLETSLTDDARVVIYDRHMFIVQAIGGPLKPPQRHHLITDVIHDLILRQPDRALTPTIWHYQSQV